MTVKALAADSIQDSIEYSIFSGNEDKIFSLDSQSGNAKIILQNLKGKNY